MHAKYKSVAKQNGFPVDYVIKMISEVFLVEMFDMGDACGPTGTGVLII